MTSSPLHILGFAGSLRARSFNRALLNAAAELAPESLKITVFDLSDIPLYNGDLDTDERRPESVRRFKTAITDANGVLIATPEYNYGVPGVLKNALDWASRPGFKSPMVYKPAAIMGASQGASGTMRGQENLKTNLLAMLASVFPHPGVAVSQAASKFDDALRLKDSTTRDFIHEFLSGFGGWVRRMV
ncbi:MAG: NAD(P)H-dependent oxidoreductase [Rhodothermales bacterium]|nr:NAD(P)H-dependent oxidoreductase [Rhodothermales bacterium]